MFIVYFVWITDYTLTMRLFEHTCKISLTVNDTNFGAHIYKIALEKASKSVSAIDNGVDVDVKRLCVSNWSLESRSIGLT
jgi:hypothetical protein